MAQHAAGAFLDDRFTCLVGRNQRGAALLEHMGTLGQILLAVQHLLGHVAALTPLAERFPFGLRASACTTL